MAMIGPHYHAKYIGHGNWNAFIREGDEHGRIILEVPVAWDIDKTRRVITLWRKEKPHAEYYLRLKTFVVAEAWKPPVKADGGIDSSSDFICWAWYVSPIEMATDELGDVSRYHLYPNACAIRCQILTPFK
jgi:hypothetical protein